MGSSLLGMIAGTGRDGSAGDESLAVSSGLVAGLSRRLDLEPPIQRLLPVAVLDDEQALVLGSDPAGHRVETERLGVVVRALDPVLGTAAHVVPGRRGGQVGLLAGPELLEVVRGGHAAGVEEVLVLANARLAGLGALALGGDAVDGDLGLVDRNRVEVADLRAELVHDVDVWVEAEVAGVPEHPVRVGLAVLLREIVAPAPQWAILRVAPLVPQQDVALLPGVVAAAELAPLPGVHGLGLGGRLAGAAPGGGRG